VANDQASDHFDVLLIAEAPFDGEDIVPPPGYTRSDTPLSSFSDLEEIADFDGPDPLRKGFECGMSVYQSTEPRQFPRQPAGSEVAIYIWIACE
jgi:hypothetical protein